MKSQHDLHQQVRCTCCFIKHRKCSVLQSNRPFPKCCTCFLYILQTSTLLPHRFLCRALSMPSVRLLFLTTFLVVLMAVLTSSARTTRWPKPQSTKKPPRAGSSGGGGGGGGGFRRTTTTTPSPSSSLHTDETTEVMMDAYSLSPTDSTTYSSDSYSTEFHTDAIAPPGNTHGNYTLDYNECFFNFCECCPPERGPVGPMGERGPSGLPGERGPLGEMDYRFQENSPLAVRMCPSYSSLFFQGYQERGEKQGQEDLQDQQDYLEPTDSMAT